MEAKTYRVNPKVKYEMIFGLVVSVLMAAVTTSIALFAPSGDKSHFPALLLCVLFSYGALAFFIWMIRMCNAYLEVTEDYITQHNPNKPSVVLAWSDITEIKNNPYMQRLELRSSHKDVLIGVEHQIINFDELRQIIASKTQKLLG